MPPCCFAEASEFLEYGALGTISSTADKGATALLLERPESICEDAMNRLEQRITPAPASDVVTLARCAPAIADILACPKCKAPLVRGAASFACGVCAESFPIIDDIACFSASDDFYDAYAAGFSPYKANPGGLKEQVLRFLPFWSWREWKFWRRVVPQCGRLLDIGCGRGRQLFEERADFVVGFDTSLVFLQECAQHYDAAVLGRVPNLPFADSSFDAVVSSHVIGHIDFAQKDALVSEIARILRPGGVTAHIIETDSEHEAVKAAKLIPQAYQRQFIDKHGHIGLELATAVMKRFERSGLRLKARRLVDAITPSVLNYRTFFKSEPGFENLPGLEWSAGLERICTASPLLNAAYEVGMGLYHETIEQAQGEPDKAQFLLVAFEKV